ncbi:MAG: DNA recombination protein RmuC, partial [Bryobacteraceae bacterium]
MEALIGLLLGILVGAAAVWLWARSDRAVLAERLRAREAELSGALEQERRSAQEKLAAFEDARQRLADAFSALAADALRSNNQAFLALAKETLEKHQQTAKSELESREQAIQHLVKPIGESLEKVDRQIQELEKTRAGAYAGLSEQVKLMSEAQVRLQSETVNLVQALRQPKARGRWGELQLQRVVELSGMAEHFDFTQQEYLATEDGPLRPDMTVYLPNGKCVVVDAKVPLKAYLEALEAPDDAGRAQKLKERRRAAVFACACSSPQNAGKMLPFQLAGIQSSLNLNFFVAGMRKEEIIEVPARTLDDILTEANAPVPIDLLSIDVESHEIEVLSGLTLSRWRPRLILIEDLAFNTRLHRLLQSRGYKWVRRAGLNGWYVPAATRMVVSLFG